MRVVFSVIAFFRTAFALRCRQAGWGALSWQDYSVRLDVYGTPPRVHQIDQIFTLVYCIELCLWLCWAENMKGMDITAIGSGCRFRGWLRSVSVVRDRSLSGACLLACFRLLL